MDHGFGGRGLKGSLPHVDAAFHNELSRDLLNGSLLCLGGFAGAAYVTTPKNFGMGAVRLDRPSAS
jgi:hypothetical protein